MNKTPTLRISHRLHHRSAALLAAVLCTGFIAAATQAQDLPAANGPAEQQMQALKDEKAGRSPAQHKMDSQLIFAGRQKRLGFAHKDVPALRVRVIYEADGRTKVDISAKVSPDLIAAIKAAGGSIINSVPEENAVRAVLPVEGIEGLAARADVKFIRPASIPVMNTGNVNSQGDVTHRSKEARMNFGANGAGIPVGVLSDSINNNANSLQAALNSGDVDPKKTFLIDGQAGQGEGEGLAMMEIVHDLAPASKLIFATGSSGEAQMAKNIRSLAANGCKIIIDDIGYFNETPFQDGIIAKAINEVSAKGILYFSSAANSGNLQTGNSGTWEGNYVEGPGNKFGKLHLFKPGVALNTVTQKSGSPTFLFWSDPLNGSANDYDLVLYDMNGNVVSISNNLQNGQQDPIEAVAPPEQGDRLAIYKYAGQKRFLHLETNRGRLAIGTTGSTKGHNASGAANAFCVAAAPAAAGNPPGPFPNPFNGNSKIENFSSDGFRRIFFQPNGTPLTPGNFTASGGVLLLKPDFTAADGVSTTLPPNSGLNPFFGTSAAAPHAGAIAAQVWSRRPAASPAQVRSALNASTIDILVNDIDPASGRGIIMAPKAVEAISNAAIVDPPQGQEAEDQLVPAEALVSADEATRQQ